MNVILQRFKKINFVVPNLALQRFKKIINKNNIIINLHF